MPGSLGLEVEIPQVLVPRMFNGLVLRSIPVDDQDDRIEVSIALNLLQTHVFPCSRNTFGSHRKPINHLVE